MQSITVGFSPVRAELARSIKLLLLYLVKINKITPSPICRVHLEACKTIWDYKIIGENNPGSILRVYERGQGNVTLL